MLWRVYDKSEMTESTLNKSKQSNDSRRMVGRSGDLPKSLEVASEEQYGKTFESNLVGAVAISAKQ